MGEEDISKFKENMGNLLISIKKKHEDCKKVGNRDFIKDLRESKDFKKSLLISLYLEYQQFLFCLGHLLNIENISYRYSETYIENLLGRLCRELLTDEDVITLLEKLCSQPSSYKDNAGFNKLIEKFLIELEKPLNTYEVFSEIEKSSIEGGGYKLIDSDIGILKEAYIHTLQTEEQNKLSRLVNKPCIYSKVEAGDIYKAKEKAVHNFKASFSFLNLYCHNLKLVLKGQSLPEIQTAVLHRGNEDETPPDESSIPELNESDYEMFVNEKIKMLDEERPIKKNIKELLYLFQLGLEQKHPLLKLINFVVVLEACLMKENERRIKCLVSKRGAFILYEQVGDQIEKVENRLSKIYKIRSDVLHEGNLNGKRIDGKDPVFLAELYSKLVLEKLIDGYKEYECVGQFIDRIDTEFQKINGCNPTEQCKEEEKLKKS